MVGVPPPTNTFSTRKNSSPLSPSFTCCFSFLSVPVLILTLTLLSAHVCPWLASPPTYITHTPLRSQSHFNTPYRRSSPLSSSFSRCYSLRSRSHSHSPYVGAPHFAVGPGFSLQPFASGQKGFQYNPCRSFPPLVGLRTRLSMVGVL